MALVFENPPGTEEGKQNILQKLLRTWKNLDRFTKFAFLTMALIVVVTPSVIAQHLIFQPHASVQTGTQFGFTIHTLNTSLTANPLPAFEANIDDLATHGVVWARFDILGSVIQSGSPSAIIWNESNLRIYDQALAYVKAKGMKVYLDTNVPFFAKQYSIGDYNHVTNIFYTFLAKRYHQYVDVWQIFNEPNWSNFRDYTRLSQQNNLSKYLTDFNDTLGVATVSIRMIDPMAKIIVNLADLTTPVIPMDTFIAGIKDHVDDIGLDIYPGTNTSKISSGFLDIEHVENVYHVPVFVTETGMCDAQFGQTVQSSSIPNYLQSFYAAGPVAILVYQYQDTIKTDTPCETSFGLIDTGGNKKPAYATVMQTMESLSNPNNSITPNLSPSPTTQPSLSPTITSGSTSPTVTPSQSVNLPTETQTSNSLDEYVHYIQNQMYPSPTPSIAPTPTKKDMLPAHENLNQEEIVPTTNFKSDITSSTLVSKHTTFFDIVIAINNAVVRVTHAVFGLFSGKNN